MSNENAPNKLPGVIWLPFALLLLKGIGLGSELITGLLWWQSIVHAAMILWIVQICLLLFQRSPHFVKMFIVFFIALMVYTLINLSIMDLTGETYEVRRAVERMYGQAIGSNLTFCALIWWFRKKFDPPADPAMSSEKSGEPKQS